MGVHKLNLHFLLFSYTSYDDLPSNKGLLSKRMWKMRPVEKMSQAVVSLSPFLQLMTSGATYPGVPHR